MLPLKGYPRSRTVLNPALSWDHGDSCGLSHTNCKQIVHGLHIRSTEDTLPIPKIYVRIVQGSVWTVNRNTTHYLKLSVKTKELRAKELQVTFKKPS